MASIIPVLQLYLEVDFGELPRNHYFIHLEHLECKIKLSIMFDIAIMGVT
jgi:hypothetical protein